MSQADQEYQTQTREVEADPRMKSILDLTVEATHSERMTRAEVDIQISTAKKFPRSLRAALKNAETMATLNEAIAESCFYSVPRQGKAIEGPSARLAEIMACAWGNVRTSARITGDDGKFITCEAVCHDLENNVVSSVEVRRRVTSKDGRRFNDDMIGVTGNAALSIAFRNAIFKTIPKAYWQPIYEKARMVAVGTAQTLVSKRTAMLQYFQKMGVGAALVCSTLGKKGEEEIGMEELAQLKGMATAIKDGDCTVDEAFPREDSPRSGPDGGAGAARKSKVDEMKAAAEASKPAPVVESPTNGGEGKVADPTSGQSDAVAPAPAADAAPAAGEVSTAKPAAGAQTSGRPKSAKPAEEAPADPAAAAAKFAAEIPSVSKGRDWLLQVDAKFRLAAMKHLSSPGLADVGDLAEMRQIVETTRFLQLGGKLQ